MLSYSLRQISNRCKQPAYFCAFRPVALPETFDHLAIEMAVRG